MLSPLSKTALRVRFCPTHPPWGLPPPGKPAPPAGLCSRTEGFQPSGQDQSQLVHEPAAKGEKFLRKRSF